MAGPHPAPAVQAPVVVVIGTGRSGTSLTMQALNALGVGQPDDLVPASENNLRGTGESIAVRDRMVALSKALGTVDGFRPHNWQNHPAAHDVKNWAAEYLSLSTARTGSTGFGVKFPMASVFLPLWIEAGQQAGVALRFVWATRNAAHTVRSLIAAYGMAEDVAQLRYVQRSYYILRDAPDDCLLLPYEGWSTDPAGQVAKLAKLAGVSDASRLAAAATSFQARLDHGSRGPEHTQTGAIQELDQLLNGTCCPLGGLIDRNSPQGLRLMMGLADTVARLTKKPLKSDDEQEMRLKLLATWAATGEQESSEMNEQIDILTQRIRDISAENRKLSQTLEAKGPKAAPAPGARQPAVARPPIEAEAAPSKASAKMLALVPELTQQIMTLLASLHSTEDTLQKTRRKLIDAETDSQAKAAELKHEQARTTKAEENHRKAQNRLAELDAERQRNVTDLVQTKAALAEAHEALALAQKTAAAELQDAQNRLAELDAERQRNDTDLVQTKAALAEAHEALALAQKTAAAELQDAQNRLAELDAERQRNDTDLVQTKAALAEAHEVNDALRAELTAAVAPREAYARLSLAHDRLEQDLAAHHQAKISTLEDRGRKMSLQVENLRSQMSNLQEKLDSLKAKYKQVEMNREALLKSTSWKITAPLRMVIRKLRGKKG